MEKLIEGAKTIIVPSEWYENCPYALLQSLAKGKVVIASRIGGLPELIDDGTTGFLFEAGNADDLCSKINHVFSINRDEYEAMSEHISKVAYERHNWEQYADFLIEEYKKLIEENN